MADKLKELLSRIEDLFAVESQSVPTDTTNEERNDRFAETSRLSNGKRRRIKFKSLDEGGLEGMRRLAGEQFSDFSTFREFTSSMSEFAQDTEQEEIGDEFATDDLFIIPIVDEEREVIGRSVFALVR
jgi:hypothetical protein